MKKSTIMLALGGVMSAAVVGAHIYANQQAELVIEQQITQFSEQSDMLIEYQGSSYNLFTNTVEVQSLVVKDALEQQTLLNIGEFSLQGYEADKVSDFTEVKLINVTLSPAIAAELEQQSKALAGAHYSLTSSMRYDEQTGNSQFKSAVEAAGVVGVEFNFDLGNSAELMSTSLEMQQQGAEITLEQELQMQSKLLSALQSLEPQKLTFAIDGQPKLDLLVTELLTSKGLTKEQFQQMLTMQLAQVPVSDAVKQGITGFVSGLNALKVDVSVDEAMNFNAFSQQVQMLAADPEGLEKFLNLKVSGS
ncbi:hypothetical protein CWB99_03980 [Pseudoalteromonas rubra]|uniref:DUF945 domain-containing protein n=1 Tax=Pseudoalteromonas rubra TaxID=43658 RepID=A0A5S3WT98_9GAMM|nr:hypothetical protein [Pseudoalteromonas rubra]TMP31421.1 hypothetical protein CWB99_03980 [Pseudoalteromonas rubra]TMP34505.1 hypothetical protein CWC00_06885 [Pseudoalteromonas rubra]